MEPTITIEKLTASKAREYLAMNATNRPLRREAVARLARDMTGGLWIFDGNPIAFDPTGALVAGQHRCHAIIEADRTHPGLSVDVCVARGVDPKAVLTSNAGVPTKPRDILAIGGHKHATNLAAAARLLSSYENGTLSHAMSNASNGSAMTNQELLAYVDARPELVDSVLAAGRLRWSGSLPGPQAALSVAHYTLVGIDAERAEEFFDRASQMILTGPGDPITTMVQRLQREVTTMHRMLPATMLFIIFRCWNAWRDGTALHKVPYGSRGSWKTLPTPH